MSDSIITILCPGTLEEQLLDTLLVAPDVTLFTSAKVAAHGVSNDNLSASEQVLGRAALTQVQVLCAAQQRGALLAALKTAFARSGLRYWVT
ncbi:DUF3240 family protein, partial [Salmonella enterica]|uniref:DUF3240 family protein n=2 Tax=Pseudomonadota TaxID=1224 RepID=UPI003CFA25F4